MASTSSTSAVPLQSASSLDLLSSSASPASPTDPSRSSPARHMEPISSSSTSSYDPASRASTHASAGESSPRLSNEAARSKQAYADDDSDGDEWDAWDEAGPSYTTAPAREAGRKGKGRGGPDDEEEDLDREMKHVGAALDDGGVALKKKLFWRHTAVTGIFVLLWYGFSTCISLYNKWFFGPKYFGFPFPLFSTFVQMIVQFLLAAAVRYSMPERFKPPHNPPTKEYGLKVFPTGAATALDVGLSNLSLKTITLSLYTMCKSSSLIFVLIFAFLFRLERFSWKLVSVIGIITAGVFLMAYTTTPLQVRGMIMVFTASVLGGLRWALTHKLMVKEELGLTNPFATIFWLAPAMAVTLAVVSILEEGWANVWNSGFFHPEMLVKTLPGMFLPGFLAFSMVASEYYIIQRAGVVPLSVAGVFKEVTTISIASWAFGDEITPINIAGLAVTMVGIAMFSHHKYKKSMQGDDDGHGAKVGESEDEENHPLTSMGHQNGVRLEDEAPLMTSSEPPSSAGGWNWFKSNPSEARGRANYEQITVFAEDDQDSPPTRDPQPR